jgi:hypothetical protein
MFKKYIFIGNNYPSIGPPITYLKKICVNFLVKVNFSYLDDKTKIKFILFQAILKPS